MSAVILEISQPRPHRAGSAAVSRCPPRLHATVWSLALRNNIVAHMHAARHPRMGMDFYLLYSCYEDQRALDLFCTEGDFFSQGKGLMSHELVAVWSSLFWTGETRSVRTSAPLFGVPYNGRVIRVRTLATLLRLGRFLRYGLVASEFNARALSARTSPRLHAMTCAHCSSSHQHTAGHIRRSSHT